MGQRLLPLTDKLPKPLVSVKGERIIERQIRFLLESGVDSITVVVGYLYEQFLYLKEMFPQVEIMINEIYDSSNNFYSLFLVRERLKDTWIIEGDIYLVKNVFRKQDRSVYYTSLKAVEEYEWYFEYDDNLKVKSIQVADRRRFQDLFASKYPILVGISFWNDISGRTIKQICEEIGNDDNLFQTYMNCYWDQIIANHLERIDLHIHPIPDSEWFEIDSVKDLEQLAKLLH